jgi:hypothetical protein
MTQMVAGVKQATGVAVILFTRWREDEMVRNEIVIEWEEVHLRSFNLTHLFLI